MVLVVGCFLAACVVGNLVGSLPEGTIQDYYHILERKAVTVQDLHYLAQINPKHEGIEVETTCPNIIQEGERDLDLLYYTVYVTTKMNSLKSSPHCKYVVTEKDEELVLKALETPANVKELYMAIGIESMRGNMVDPEDAIPLYMQLLKEDDSVLAGSLAVIGSTMLWRANPEADLEPLLKLIDVDDMFAQADSFDKQLSFDGDIVTTATFVKACIAIGEYSGKFPLSADQMVGFGNFVVRGVQPVTTSELFYFISFVSDLSNNKFSQPLHVKLISRKPFHRKSPVVVAVFQVDGGFKKNAQVAARSITRVKDNEVVASGAKFKYYSSKKEDAQEKDFSNELFYEGVYELNDFMAADPTPGYYDLEVEVTGESYFSFTDDAIRFRLKVTTQAEIQNIKVGFAVKKGEELNWHDDALPEEVASVGRNGQFKVEFQVVDAQSKEDMAVHQAFVRCLNTINNHATVFIAEKNKKGKYAASFDVSEHFEFGGVHRIDIHVGDAILHPGLVEHTLGKVTVNGVPEPEPAAFTTKYLEKYRSLTPIEHTFKEPEPRPPVAISLIFTAACALPLLGLLVFWGRLGVNVNRMESAFLPFHLSIASVFGLYFLYWLKLDMFTTLKYLAVLGSATFILGNRVLSSLATKEK